MSEGPEEITVKVKYDSNKNDMIDVKIRPNTEVFRFELAIENELKKNNINDIPVELLKFNGQELDDKDKKLEELGIINGSEIENENRVVLIKPFTGKTIYITCDENTTVREFLKQLKGKNPEFSYIRLSCAGAYLQRSTLDQKLLGCQMGIISIKYGAILHPIILLEAHKSDTVFDLNNLEESKNSNLVKVSGTLTNHNVSNLESLDNNPRISSDSKKESKNSNYPLLRIIVGIIDLILLAAAITTFLLFFLTTLSLSIAVPIVLTALFVVGAILFFGWNTILPKILPKSCLEKLDLGIGLNEEYKNEIKETENYEKNNPKEEENKNEKEKNKNN